MVMNGRLHREECNVGTGPFDFDYEAQHLLKDMNQRSTKMVCIFELRELGMVILR